MKNFTKSFKSKKFRYGAFSTFIAMFAIGILFMVNIVVEQLNIRIDMTHLGLYTLSDRSVQFVRELDEPIRIYTLHPTGQDQNIFTELLHQYQQHSSNISVSNRDPFIHRAFVDQFAAEGQQISPDSIIIVSERRHRVIPAMEMLAFARNPHTGQSELVALNIEARVTNAIAYTIAETTYVMYQLEGAGHLPIPPEFIHALELSNFSHGHVNLTLEDIPEHVDVIVITTPSRDFNEVERDKMISWLELGGSAMFLIDVVPFDMPNLHAVVNTFGLEFTGYYVLEGHPARHFPGFNNYVFPLLATNHFIGLSIHEQGNDVMLLNTQGIDQYGIARTFLHIAPLLQTTNQAWGRNNPAATSPNRESGEPEGPFVVGAAVVEQFSTVAAFHEARLVVLGTANLFHTEANSIVRGTNTDFFINSMNWLVGRVDGDALFIPPRSLANDQFLMMSEGDQNNIMMLSLAGVPGVVAVAGLIVWLRRRNK